MKVTSQTKRLILSAAWLLLINCVACVCCMTAQEFYRWMENPVAAAPFALVYFLLAFWQPWLFLFLYPGVVALTAPFLSIPITLAVYQTLSRRGKMNWLRRIWFRSPRRWAGYIALFLLLNAVVVYAGYKDFPVQHRGVPTSLPDPDFQTSRYGLTNSRCYTLSHFIDSSFLWRVRVPRAQLPALTKSLYLARVPKGTLSDRFWSQPPYWWRRPSGAAGEEYQTVGFSAENRGDDGWHAGAVYDPRTEMLSVWGKDNF